MIERMGPKISSWPRRSMGSMPSKTAGAREGEGGGGGAAVAGRAEGGPHDAVRGQFEVGVGHDDDAVLAAQLEGQALEAPGRRLRDGRARGVVAGEADDRDVGALHDGQPHVLAGAGHEVDRAGREARLVHQLGQQDPAGGGGRGRLEGWRRPTTSRVSAGLTLSKVRPVTLSPHSPPMKLPWVVGAAAPVASGGWSISWLIGGFYARDHARDHGADRRSWSAPPLGVGFAFVPPV